MGTNLKNSLYQIVISTEKLQVGNGAFSRTQGRDPNPITSRNAAFFP